MPWTSSLGVLSIWNYSYLVISTLFPPKHRWPPSRQQQENQGTTKCKQVGLDMGQAHAKDGTMLSMGMAWGRTETAGARKVFGGPRGELK